MSQTLSSPLHLALLFTFALPACGLDSLPERGGNDAGSPDGFWQPASGGAPQNVIVIGRGAGGSPSFPPETGDGVGGTGWWGNGAIEPHSEYAECQPDCPPQAGSYCIEDALAYIYCSEGTTGAVDVFCFEGHDGYGNCYPRGCTTDLGFPADECAEDPVSNPYCQTSDAGIIQGRPGPCPIQDPDSQAAIPGRCQRSYAVCFELTIATCPDGQNCLSDRSECVRKYDLCVADQSACGDQLEDCLALAGECSQRLGDADLCADHLAFCAALEDACVP